MEWEGRATGGESLVSRIPGLISISVKSRRVTEKHRVIISLGKDYAGVMGSHACKHEYQRNANSNGNLTLRERNEPS